MAANHDYRPFDEALLHWMLRDTITPFSNEYPHKYPPAILTHQFSNIYDTARFLPSASQKQVARNLWTILITKSGVPLELDEIERLIRLADVPAQEQPHKVKIGNIEFEAIVPSHLAPLHVLIQALDNQWLPRSLLLKVLQKKRFTKRIEEDLVKYVRTEYLRGLINGRQVVINRAYLYNNSVVFQDYLPGSQNREAFKELLNSNVIVPYLFRERSPVEPPPFNTASQGFLAWHQVCQEVHMQCVRLSWNDQLNEQLSREQLALQFHQFAQNLAEGDLEKYVRDLDVDPNDSEQLKITFEAIERFCQELMQQERIVTRTDLYKKFVIAGSDPVERKYDRNKPFSGEIKLLLDLAYNSYLADALGGYLLTPVDSLPRTALQEWEQARGNQSLIDGGELIRLLRLSGFVLIQGGMYLKSLSLLNLYDVQTVRQMDEWVAYIQLSEALLNNPSWFVDGSAAGVYQNYANLMKKITHLIVQRSPRPEAELTELWTPVTELLIEVAGAKLSVIWTSEGPRYLFTGDTLPQVATSGAAPLVARFNIYGWDGTNPQADLVSTYDFRKGVMQDAQKQWVEIQRQVKELPGFQERLSD